LADTSGGGFTPATRGYLYLRIPSTAATAAASIRNEWADLKSVAGTGEAVAFGRWQYMGSLEDIQAPPPSRSGVTAAGTRIMDVRGLIVAPNGGGVVNLRVRHAAEPVVNPIDYAANVGVVKLTEASHAAVLKALREAR
jgi:hypothetical protein